MNTLEKAQIIKELDTLINDLEHRALSMFETARSKQRLKNIFELCDEPGFHKQLLEYRAITQPDIAAAQYVAKTPYQLSYRGFFYQDQDLEQALYQFPEYGWAMLYRPRYGWQMWLIPAKNKSALISEWGPIQASYEWMEEQIQLYQCLMTDEQLKAQVAVLSQQKLTRFASPPLLEPIEPIIEQVIDVPADVPMLEVAPAPIPEPIVVKVRPAEHFQLYDQRLHLAAAQNTQDLPFYRYEIQNSASNSEYLDVYLKFPFDAPLTHHPVFITEQLTVKGGFYKYSLFLGYNDFEQLQQTHQQQFGQYGVYLASIKQCEWQSISQAWHTLEGLADYYDHLPDILWQKKNYTSFIPYHLIQSQKFIHFDEPHASERTPVLLLKERGKLRVIHGQKRLYLKSHELALPYLLLNREDGFNWQQIKQVISELSHPVDVHELHEALLHSVL